MDLVSVCCFPLMEELVPFPCGNCRSLALRLCAGGGFQPGARVVLRAALMVEGVEAVIQAKLGRGRNICHTSEERRDSGGTRAGKGEGVTSRALFVSDDSQCGCSGLHAILARTQRFFLLVPTRRYLFPGFQVFLEV